MRRPGRDEQASHEAALERSCERANAVRSATVVAHAAFRVAYVGTRAPAGGHGGAPVRRNGEGCLARYRGGATDLASVRHKQLFCRCILAQASVAILRGRRAQGDRLMKPVPGNRSGGTVVDRHRFRTGRMQPSIPHSLVTIVCGPSASVLVASRHLSTFAPGGLPACGDCKGSLSIGPYRYS